MTNSKQTAMRWINTAQPILCVLVILFLWWSLHSKGKSIDEMSVMYQTTINELKTRDAELATIQQVNDAYADSLINLGFQYMGIADSLKNVIIILDNEKSQIESNLLAYTLPVDSLVADLNRIWASVQSGEHDRRHDTGHTQRTWCSPPKPFLQFYSDHSATFYNSGQRHISPRRGDSSTPGDTIYDPGVVRCFTRTYRDTI